jgi:hypothetical protein
MGNREFVHRLAGHAHRHRTEEKAPELSEVRARQLVKVGRRLAIAGQIETCVETAAVDSHRRLRAASVWQVDLRSAEVQAASTELLELARILRSGKRVNARGVAMAMRLVRDGESPLYVARGADDIARAASAATAALALPARPSP